VEANKVLLEERLKIDKETAIATSNIFARYGIGRITSLEIELETENQYDFIIKDDNEKTYFVSMSKWDGTVRILENDRNGKMIYGIINAIPPEIVEEYAKAVEEAEKRRQAAKDARNNANTLEQDSSAAASTNADNSVATENTSASEFDTANANDGADANTNKD
jgi:hypothetical protein